jgi:rubredoxin
MDRYECTVCGWIYEEENGYPAGGIDPGVKFDELKEDWFCPLCSAGKGKFRKISD